MKKKNQKLILKKEVISKINQHTLLGGNIDPSRTKLNDPRCFSFIKVCYDWTMIDTR